MLERTTIQRKKTARSELNRVQAPIQAALSSNAHPLNPATCAAMEPRFGYDFGQVRLHTSERAARSARALGARAYTVGGDVVFGAGQYAPETAEGRRLIAHELTHVVQQGGQAAAPQARLTTSAPDDAAEQEAEALAGRVVEGRRVQVRQVAGAQVQGDWLDASGVARDEPAVAAEDQDESAAPETSAQSENAEQAALTGVVLGALITPSYGGPISTSDYGPGIHIQSPRLDVGGSVLLDATRTRDNEYEIGFMQTLAENTGLKGVYMTQEGQVHWIREQYYKVAPVRDGDAGVKPWYGQETVQPVNSTNGATSMNDQPGANLVWQSPDGLGMLTSCEGRDTFGSWLVLRHKATGALSYLAWLVWTVDWSCAFDAQKRTAVVTGQGGQVVGSGEGQGLITPLTEDPVANAVMGARDL